MGFWSWNLKFEFLKTEDLSLKFGHWECAIESLGMKIFELKIWILKDKLWKRFFFLGWVSQLNLTELTYLWLSLSVWGPKFCPLPPFPQLLCLSLFLFASSSINFFFLHWHYSPSSSPWFFFFISPFLLTKNTFLSFLTLSFIHLHQYFFRSLCFEHFHPTPILVKPIFKIPFSLHQNGFFLQGIFFSSFSW